MPNRILRDWTDSDKINELTVYAERFFVRLIMKVDDYGCFYADTRLLKANLFPLLIDTIREADIIRWMAECQKSELIVLYESSNKKYLQIVNFKQRLDRAKSKYPMPNETKKTITTDSLENDNDLQAETETKQKPKGNESVGENNSLTTKVFNLDYFFSIGYEQQWNIQSESIKNSIDKFLMYRHELPHKEPIKAPMVVEAIIKRLRETAKNESDVIFMINNTIEKGAKNIIYELQKPASNFPNQQVTKKYKPL